MNVSKDAPALVILAAGLGSRYGDAKQIAGIGPHGEWLLEYAIHDAVAAGFTQVVMVIRESLRGTLQQRLAPHLEGRAALRLVAQTFDKIPAGALKIEIMRADHTAYSKKLNKVVMMSEAPDHTKEDFILLSGTKVREMLGNGIAPPPEFSRPEVAQILIDHYSNEG